jgi:hypothetical protein
MPGESDCTRVLGKFLDKPLADPLGLGDQLLVRRRDRADWPQLRSFFGRLRGQHGVVRLRPLNRPRPSAEQC